MAKQTSTTLVANGDSSVVDWAGGVGFFGARGTFGSGTVKLMVSFDGGSNYQSAGSDGEFTSDGVVMFTLPRCLLKATLSGSTSPSLYVTIESLV